MSHKKKSIIIPPQTMKNPLEVEKEKREKM